MPDESGGVRNQRGVVPPPALRCGSPTSEHWTLGDTIRVQVGLATMPQRNDSAAEGRARGGVGTGVGYGQALWATSHSREHEIDRDVSTEARFSSFAVLG